MYLSKVLILFIFILLSTQNGVARSVIVPKRETAVMYYLQLSNTKSNQVILLESKIPEFEIPEDIEGDYSIQVSFSDKWGRKIEGHDPKVITLINKKKDVELLAEKTEIKFEEHSTVGIVFNPYVASGTYTADLNDSSTNIKKGSLAFRSTGMKTILKINSIRNLRFGIDFMQGSTPEKSLKSTEASIAYDWYQHFTEKNETRIAAGIAGASTQIKGQFSDGASTVNSSAQASSTYLFGQFFYSHHFSNFYSETLGMLGASQSYFRYDIGQAVLYKITNFCQVGPWINYGKFENGTKDGSIKANSLKLGLNLNLSL